MRPALRTDPGGLATGTLMAGLFNVAAVRHVFWDRPSEWSPDAFVVHVVGAGLCFGVPFLAVHLLLSRARLSRRLPYVAAGAACLLFSFVANGGREIIDLAGRHGMVSVAVAAPALFGCMLGFLYQRRAGFAAAGDDPDRLAVLIRARDEPRRDAAAAAGVTSTRPARPVPEGDRVVGPVAGRPALSEDAALAATGEAEYFSGPLQVRTSLPAIAITGLSAGAAWAVIKLVLASASIVGAKGPHALAQTAVEGGASPLFGVVVSTVTGALLFPVPVYVGHVIARSRRWTSYEAYAAVGALLPVAAGLMMFVVGLMATVQFVAPMALAMVFYRNLAGLEPLALPEDVQVTDRRTLVGAHHLRRRFNRVVDGQ